MSSIYDTEERVEQGLGNIKEENGYQQWDMMASRGLMCSFMSPIFLSKLLKKNSYSVIHESFFIFFERPGALRSVGLTQSELT